MTVSTVPWIPDPAWPAPPHGWSLWMARGSATGDVAGKVDASGERDSGVEPSSVSVEADHRVALLEAGWRPCGRGWQGGWTKSSDAVQSPSIHSRPGELGEGAITYPPTARTSRPCEPSRPLTVL